MRDEKLWEGEEKEEEDGGTGKYGKEGVKMLEKMLAEQPPAPMTLWEMFHGQLKHPNLTSFDEIPLERFSSHLHNQPLPLLFWRSQLTTSPDTKIHLPSSVAWCRQCDQNGHIDYSAISCGRCASNHQTSACPITIMGVCIYCSAVGMHFSQLCPKRRIHPFCGKCGRNGHIPEDCLVIPQPAYRETLR